MLMKQLVSNDVTKIRLLAERQLYFALVNLQKFYDQAKGFENFYLGCNFHGIFCADSFWNAVFIMFLRKLFSK